MSAVDKSVLGFGVGLWCCVVFVLAVLVDADSRVHSGIIALDSLVSCWAMVTKVFNRMTRSMLFYKPRGVQF
jgi:hypothetical protein